jgi:hypothetical protein
MAGRFVRRPWRALRRSRAAWLAELGHPLRTAATRPVDGGLSSGSTRQKRACMPPSAGTRALCSGGSTYRDARSSLVYRPPPRTAGAPALPSPNVQLFRNSCVDRCYGWQQSTAEDGSRSPSSSESSSDGRGRAFLIRLQGAPGDLPSNRCWRLATKPQPQGESCWGRAPGSRRCGWWSTDRALRVAGRPDCGRGSRG